MPWPVEDRTGDTKLLEAWRNHLLKQQALSSRPVPIRRATGPLIEVQRNFLYVEDREGVFSAPFIEDQELINALGLADASLTSQFRGADEFDVAIVFTSFDTGRSDFFYLPFENEITGIGPSCAIPDTFTCDGSEDSPRKGMIFMNKWSFFQEWAQANPDISDELATEQSRSVFNQEVGHRWGAFVQSGLELNGQGNDVLLGRQDAHWNFYLQSNDSPMEGNKWRDNGNGTFTTITSIRNWFYSDLDLYLMGFLPPEDVADFFVIQNPRLVSGANQLPSRSGTPAAGFTVTVRGDRVDLSINEIIARNGPRNPTSATALRNIRVAFILLATPDNPADRFIKQDFAALVDDYANSFRTGARNLGQLNYELAALSQSPLGGPCDSFIDCNPDESTFCRQPTPGDPGICSIACANTDVCPDSWCCESAVGALSKVCRPAVECVGESQPETTPTTGKPSAPPPRAPPLNEPAGGCSQTGYAATTQIGLSLCLLFLLPWRIQRHHRRAVKVETRKTPYSTS
jgi:hypothetical protein